MSVPPNPEIPAHPLPFTHRLAHFAARFDQSGPIKIVAIGSSSTAGEGGIAPFTQRLEAALRDPISWDGKPDRFKNRMIDVVNRGVGGEEAPDEVKRLRTGVIDEQPALVIWQVGTNAAWKGDDLALVAAALDAGLEMLLSASSATDVVLMDLQYAPAVLSDNKIGATRQMVSRIASASTSHPPVNLFQRFDLMRRWHEVERVSFDRMIDPCDADRLHQSDWSARRIGLALCELIVDAATRSAPTERADLALDAAGDET